MGRMAVAAIVSMWIIPISITFNKIVPDPYMDEVFHVLQAQRYCRGDFKTWDPMITTPPGLYYLSLAYGTILFPGMWLAKGIQSFPELCSTAFLRSTNAVMAVACSVLVFDLLIVLRPSLSQKKATLFAVVIALYPLHWFFTFLYYTDVASLTAFLAMYLASLKGQFWISAMCGAFSMLLRQTNVVWVAFAAFTAAISYVEDFYKKDQLTLKTYKLKSEKKAVLFDKNNSVIGPTQRKKPGLRSSKNSIQSANSKGFRFLPRYNSGLINEIIELSLKLWPLKRRVLATFFPYILVLMAFGAFVLLNGGIVLGAKEAHFVSPHFPQLMYFGLAAAAALAPVHFTAGQASILWGLFRRNYIGYSVGLLATLLMCIIFVHCFSIAHPYLLADNRHYTFYMWRKMIQSHWSMKYLLSPVYIYSWVSIIISLGKARNKVWVLLFCLSSSAVLIPTPLIEFRYYTIPVFILILNSRIEEKIKWILIGILYLFVNIFTVLVFLYRPFQWDHEPGNQRFIW